jgi:hypothetical protein
MLHRLLFGVVIVLGLTIVIAMLISATLVGALLVFYNSALVYGFEPHIAVGLTFLLSLIFILALIICTNMCLKNFRKVSKTAAKPSPLASSALSVLDSFTDGFMAE